MSSRNSIILSRRWFSAMVLGDKAEDAFQAIDDHVEGFALDLLVERPCRHAYHPRDAAGLVACSGERRGSPDADKVVVGGRLTMGGQVGASEISKPDGCRPKIRSRKEASEMTSDKRVVAFLGIGLMGSRQARRLLDAGYSLTVWNRSRAKAGVLAPLGARVVDMAADAARDADIVILMLENGAAVADVLFKQGVANTVRPGSIVIDMSSIKPAEAQEHARVLLERRLYVNVASVAGNEANPNVSDGSASGAAVIGLTKSLRQELAKSGVIASSVTPAPVRRPIFNQINQAHIDFFVFEESHGMLGTVDEVTSLTCWLASDECSFTTGGVFDISGGHAPL